MRVYVHTLGCPKNQVDGEYMVSLLLRAGHTMVAHPEMADAIVVNTCGFIDSAKQESLGWLLHYSRSGLGRIGRRHPRQADREHRRNTGRSRPAVIAAGCLAQRYGGELLRDLPELSGVLGSLRWAEIEPCLREAANGNRPCWVGSARGEPKVARLAYGRTAYLKIADGCSTRCAFCAIPQIKGPLRSRPASDIVDEARQLVHAGVVEVILVAQDTTAYGHDRGLNDGLAELIEHLLDAVPELPWLRLLYAHPEHITSRLLNVVAAYPQVLKYLDLPLQHSHPAVLSRMSRPALDHRRLVRDLRAAVPELAIRSSFIVGFPGERDEEFEDLLQFLLDARLDRVGVFQYSPEDGTPAANLGGQISQRRKAKRYRQAMCLQRDISLSRNQEMVGRVLDVLVESESASDRQVDVEEPLTVVGRSYRDAPEIDGQVYVNVPGPGSAVGIGCIVPVRITGAQEYDLVGEVAGAVRSQPTWLNHLAYSEKDFEEET